VSLSVICMIICAYEYHIWRRWYLIMCSSHYELYILCTFALDVIAAAVSERRRRMPISDHYYFQQFRYSPLPTHLRSNIIISAIRRLRVSQWWLMGKIQLRTERVSMAVNITYPSGPWNEWWHRVRTRIGPDKHRPTRETDLVHPRSSIDHTRKVRIANGI